ncbi:hypothetical protein [Rivularia sp. UHCC 0363]|uniref:hypothetical protein n=1 Tax=Rivularia sp. UHCC 0363 TaxID=3110244 RepID=UPI002B1FF3C4|nr:hypothetical protein [Rivularia sp. UHCC 0363]MEA5594747.1 hypothetical protein [Rivularia sp. UHCC 0363]
MLENKLDRNVIDFSPSSNTSEISTPEKENVNQFENPARKERCLLYAKGKNLIHEKLARQYILKILIIIEENKDIARDMHERINGIESYLQEKDVSKSEILEQDRRIKDDIDKLNQDISFVKNIIQKYKISPKDELGEDVLYRLSYILRYLAMNLRLDYIISENSEFLSEHLLRITYYIHELMVSSRKLCEIVIAEINSRVPGRGGDNLSLDRHRDKNKY